MFIDNLVIDWNLFINYWCIWYPKHEHHCFCEYKSNLDIKKGNNGN